MKRIITLVLLGIGVGFSGTAQIISYSGGNGSGYISQNSPAVFCSNFLGGNFDGAATSKSAATICPPFFGGNADGYSGSQSSSCSIVVAAKLITFYGEKELHRNILHWKVTDFDVRVFEIQKSSDGITFEHFGTVAGSTVINNSYLFIDNAPFSTVTFYRLLINETNSLNSYSDVIVLRYLAKSSLMIYPNPSQGLATLSYYSEKAHATTLSIFQTDGKEIMLKTINVKTGRNHIPINLNFLPDGVYFIKVGTNGERLSLILSR